MSQDDGAPPVSSGKASLRRLFGIETMPSAVSISKVSQATDQPTSQAETKFRPADRRRYWPDVAETVMVKSIEKLGQTQFFMLCILGLFVFLGSLVVVGVYLSKMSPYAAGVVAAGGVGSAVALRGKRKR